MEWTQEQKDYFDSHFEGGVWFSNMLYSFKNGKSWLMERANPDRELNFIDWMIQSGHWFTANEIGYKGRKKTITQEQADKLFPKEPEKPYTPTRREYFAAAALQGILSGNGSWAPYSHPSAVGQALRFSDEIIAALDKEKEGE